MSSGTLPAFRAISRSLNILRDGNGLYAAVRSSSSPFSSSVRSSRRSIELLLPFVLLNRTFRKFGGSGSRWGKTSYLQYYQSYALDSWLSRNGDDFQVICRKGVAPYILDVESTRRLSVALVHDLQALLSARKKIIFSPLAQGDNYREQLAALLG